MTLPRNYDTLRLSGPEEPDEPRMEECPECEGTSTITGRFSSYKCETCHGTGEVEADAEEYENERGEWLRDRRDGL